MPHSGAGQDGRVGRGGGEGLLEGECQRIASAEFGIVWRVMAQSNMATAMYPHVPAVPDLVGGLRYRKFQGFGFGAKSAVGWTESRCRRVRKTVLFSKRTTEDSSRVA